MSASLNKVIIVGNVTRDPDVRYTSKGTAVCDLGVAVNTKFTGRDNEEAREEVYFAGVVVWGKMGEACGKYLTKGSGVLVEGRLKREEWTDSNGVKKEKTKIVAERVQFLGGGRERSSEPEHREAPSRKQETRDRTPEPSPVDDDEIPF